MLDYEDIEKRLKGVDPQLCVAFAARCSLRVLPLLVLDKKKEAFWYWQENKRAGYVLSILTAQQVSINFSAFGKKINIAAAASYAAAADASYVSYASYAAAADASYAAAAAASYAAKAAAARAAAARAATAAARAARTSINLKREIESDLRCITQNHSSLWKKLTRSSDQIAASALIAKPLWLDKVPEDWLVLQSRFQQSLLTLGAGFDIWVDWYCDRINGVALNLEQEQQCLDVPAEIREQGTAATNAYIATLQSSRKTVQSQDNLQPLNLVRAIFIGNGAAGKTSLIRKLNGEPVVEGREEMTPGIEIREWSVPGSALKARFWDFGGQVMSHSTHQFFLRERCLYILVLDARSEFNANDQAEYWLEHVKAFGNKAPVMLVGNKSELTAVNLDMNALRDKYKNIVDFYAISCTSKKDHFTRRFDLFKSDLSEQLQAVGTGQIMFTGNQFTVLEQVRELSRQSAFLHHDRFDSLCNDNDIGKVGLDQTAFLGLLDSLGEIIHFPDLEWSDAYVLNPRWLTYGVYTLLYSSKAEQQAGELSHADVIEILHPKIIKDEQGNELNYPKEKCRFIIDAMSRFKLCYHLSCNQRFVIPDKLPTEQPNLSPYFDKSAEGTLSIEFNFQGLLPRNVMPNLIVARHKDIVKDNEGKQLVWQHGVLIHHEEYQSTARLQVDYHQRTLQFWIQGEEKREHLVLLRDEAYAILNVIKGLLVDEYVILPIFARINREHFRLDNDIIERITYKSLIEQAKAGQRTVFSDAGNQYDLAKIMGFIMTEEQQKKAGVNVSYHIENLGALGGVGDDHKIKGKVILNSSQKQHTTELQESLTTLMSQIENHDTDFKLKAAAYAELQQIRQHLETIDKEGVTAETKQQLLPLLTKVKDGSLGAIQLAKDIKESSETLTWVMERAVAFSAILSTLPSL